MWRLPTASYAYSFAYESRDPMFFTDMISQEDIDRGEVVKAEGRTFLHIPAKPRYRMRYHCFIGLQDTIGLDGTMKFRIIHNGHKWYVV